MHFKQQGSRAATCDAVCCSMLQCFAVCCSVLQCVAQCCSELQCEAGCCGVTLFFAVSYRVLLCL